MIRYRILDILISPITWFYTKKLEGKHNIPEKCPYIIASNHNSVSDELFIAYIFVKRMSHKLGALARFKPTKNSIFQKTVIQFLEWFCMQFFVIISVLDRDPVSKSVKALKEGNVLLIFPEGVYNNDENKLKPAKKGTARIALGSRVPVLPIGIIGSERIIPPFGYFPRFRRATIKIGKAMNFDEIKNTEENVNQVTEKIMREISRLCNKEYGGIKNFNKKSKEV